eukprot:s2836_g5.t1
MGSRLERNDPSIETHDAYYDNVASEQDVNIVENVPEYEKEVKRVKASLGPGWNVLAVKLDPRVFGLGVARARIYIVAIRTSKLRWKPKFSMQEFIDALTSQVCLVATDYWWKNLPPQILSPSDETWLHFFIAERNLKEYQKSRYCDKKIADLSQLARNNRARGETKDNALCTLTTNSAKLYSKASPVLAFDISAGDHPVAFCLVEYSTALCDPLGTWLNEIAPGTVANMESVDKDHAERDAFMSAVAEYNSYVDNPLWHNILTVDDNKQVLFLQRILFLHARASKRGGRAATCRLALGEWNNEVERMCLAFHIMDQMTLASGHDGKPLFDAATLDKVDDKLDAMSKDARKTPFQQDCLKLTRDVAQLGILYQEEVKSDRSNRLQRVLHLKHQNRVGASVISKFMEMNMHCVAGRPGELETAADKAGAFPN